MSTPTEVIADLASTGLDMPSAKLNFVLATTWPQLHAPLRHVSADTLIGLFRRAGYVADGPLPPAQDITVYRGELADAAETGIAWSASLDVATDYARRYATAGPTRVLQATATPESVLGRFTLEDEFVVVPDLLTGTVSLGGFPHFTLPLLA